MSSWLILVGVALIFFGLGRYVGLTDRGFREKIERLLDHFEEAEAEEELATGVTHGLYEHVNEVTAETRPKEQTTGVVKSKSPKTLEREALERMNVASTKWGLTDKDE